MSVQAKNKQFFITQVFFFVTLDSNVILQKNTSFSEIQQAVFLIENTVATSIQELKSKFLE
jgi:hypothetical protein